MSWIHLRGVGPGRLVGNVLASLKISAFVLFIVLGFAFGTGSMSNLTAVAGSPSPGSMAVRAGAGALHLLRDGTPRRMSPRRSATRAQRPAGAGAGDARRGRDLPAAERALSLRAAGRGAGGGARQRPRRDRRSAARHQRRQHHGRRLDRQPARQHQRDGVRRPARLLRHGPRRHVLPGSGAGAPALPHPGDVDRRAGPVEQRARALGQRQRAHHLHRVLDHPVQRRRRRGALRPAPARADRRRARFPPGAIRWCQASSWW